MAKKTVNSDIYNLSQLVDDVKSVFLPDETDETLAIGTYGYIGALESNRLQTQVEMTGELCNESFPSRARLERNIITHAILANIEDINAKPSKMVVNFYLREKDIANYFDSENIFIVDRECPIFIGDYEFHLEYDIKLKRIYIEKKKSYAYTAQYIIPSNRDVPTSTINKNNQYLSPPTVLQMRNDDGYIDNFIVLTVIISQVQHSVVSRKLVTSNVIDNKVMNFEFQDQLAYFEVHCSESDEDYYVIPVFEGSSVPASDSQYYCWYQYIDTNLIRIRFDRKSYMPGLNANIEILIKTTKGSGGNFTFGENTYVTLESNTYGYKGISMLVSPASNAEGGKDRKSKKELQALIPKESFSRGSLTTITDLNNYFSMLDSELGRIIIQKKIDNQIERVYYAYLIAKDNNGDVIPSNTLDIKVGLEDLVMSQPLETDSPRYILKSGACFRLGADGTAYINDLPLISKGYVFTPKAVTRGGVVEMEFYVTVTGDADLEKPVSCYVDLGGDNTKVHVFPEDEDNRLRYINSFETVLVEDGIQMGTGKSYIYSADYIVNGDNTIISVRDRNMDCLDFEDAWYTTTDGVTKHFASLPMTATFEAGTRVTFFIKRKLNAKATGVVDFTHDTETYRANQKTSIEKLSTVLGAVGLDVGEVQNAVSSNPEVLLLTENGEINPGPGPEPPTPVVNPYKRSVVTEDMLPDVSQRSENEWFVVVDGESISQSSDADFSLTVNNTDEMPPVEDRAENEWQYGINRATDQYNAPVNPDIVHSDAPYQLVVAGSEDIPPVYEREEGTYYYNILNATIKSDDPDDPPVPTELTGKEYKVDLLQDIVDPVTITVTISGVDYEITVTQNKFILENTVTVTEDEDEKKVKYTTYLPTLDQDVWPDAIAAGDRYKYTLRYVSTSNTYAPKITIIPSDGLEYEPFSLIINNPDGTSYSYEPVEVSLTDKRGFIYTNPYAININASKLYSSFYMMSMNENPFLHFDWVNDKSNVQYIATNVYWTRDFSGVNKDNYKLRITITQSVQSDLGVDPDMSDPNVAPMIKVIAVFKRDGSPYRYRSLKYVPGDDVAKSLFQYTFEQSFESTDKFDNDNNIEVKGFQATSQPEYYLNLTYDDTYSKVLNNGGNVLLSDLLNEFHIELSEEGIKSITSSDIDLGIVPILNDQGEVEDYKIISYNYLEEDTTIDIEDYDEHKFTINVHSTNPAEDEYGFFNPNTDIKIYVLCGLPDINGNYSRNDFDSIDPGLTNWTLTNTYDVVNGVTMYHNYSEIMGSRVTPYGKTIIENGNRYLKLEGFYVKGVPLLGFDYCQNEALVQNAIDSLNYRKAYIDNAVTLLENSFGVDFKLFNSYGPSKTYYIIRDTNRDSVLNDEPEFIDRVNLTFYFRIRLISESDSYTKANIIAEIKKYIEDLDDIGDLHIPNLVTQITTNYKEQISYFEYLGFNSYGPDVQHMYRLDDDETPIHVAPEFLNVHNLFDVDGNLTPDINVYVSEI